MFGRYRVLFSGTLLATFMGLSIFRLPAANLIHRYNFSTDGSDSIGAAHGTLEGGATISGGAVQLNGVSAYVNLPNDILQPLDSLTIEVWLTDNYSGNWARIFDFGNSTAGEDVPASGTQYLFLSSQSGGGTLRGAITLNANSGVKGSVNSIVVLTWRFGLQRIVCSTLAIPW